MTDDARARGGDELNAMDWNRGRFGIEHDNVRNLYRVVDLGSSDAPRHSPLCEWMDHEAALAVRDDYFMGRRTP